MGATTIEELEIVISTKIEQVRPQLQKFVNEIKNAVKETEGIGSNLVEKINTKKIKNDVSEAKKQIDKMFEEDNTSAQEKYLQSRIESLRKNIEDVKAFNSNLKHPDLAELYGTEPEKILKMEADLEKLENRLKKIQAKKIKGLFEPDDTTGIKINGQRIISGVSQAFDKLKGMKIDIGNAIELNNYKNKLIEAKNIAQETRQEISKIGYVKYDKSQIQNFVDSFGKGANEVKQVKNSLKNSTNNGSKLSAIISKIKSNLEKIHLKTKSFSTGLEGAKNIAGKISTKLKVGLGQIIKMAGALLGLRSLYNVLRNSASAWLSSQNEQAQQLQANINYMKYALGSSLAPVIETIVNLIYQALKGVQSLIYALTGVNIFANASAKAYASMANSAKNAKNDTKALAGIHNEINNVSDNKSTNSGSETGIPNFDLSGLETADWIQKLVNNIKDGNWYEIGATIGNKINETLEKIPWKKIKEKAGNLGKDIANFFNGGIESTNWDLVGKSIAEGLNTIIELIYNFVTSFEWKEAGKAIGDSINGFFKNTEWDKLATSISEGIKGLLDTAITVIDELDTDEIVDAIERFFSNIDFPGIITRLATFLNKLFVKALEAIINLGIDAINGINSKLPKGLQGAWYQVFGEIERIHLDENFVLLKGALSDVTYETNKSTKATKEYKKEVQESSKRVNILTNKVDKLTEKIYETGESTENAGDEIKTTISNVMFELHDTIISKFEQAKQSAQNSIQNIRKTTENEGYKTEIATNQFMSNIRDVIKEKFEQARQVAQTSVEKIRNSTENEGYNTEKTTNQFMSNINNTIISKFEHASEKVRTSMDTIEKTTEREGNNMKSTVSIFMSNIHDTITSKFESAKQKASTFVNELENNTEKSFDKLNKSSIFQTLGSKLETLLNKANEAHNAGQQVAQSYEQGLRDNIGTQQTSNSIVSKLSNTLNLKYSAYYWGQDLVRGLANGINDAKGLAVQAAAGVAKGITAYIHFSKPDKGPLREYESWMPDMIKGLSYGLTNSMPILENALNGATSSIANKVKALNLDSSITQNLNTNMTGLSSILDNSISNAMSDILSDDNRVLNITVNVGNDKLGNILLEDLRNKKRQTGQDLEVLVGG